jgi:hypothetical protein
MSRQRAKGTRWESRIVAFLAAHGFPHVERRALNGATDKGDITGIPGVVIEAKDQNRHSWAEWLDEATQEAENANADVGVVWAHRRGYTDPGKGYVVLDGRTFVWLLRSAGYGDPIEEE